MILPADDVRTYTQYSSCLGVWVPHWCRRHMCLTWLSIIQGQCGLSAQDPDFNIYTIICNVYRGM